VSNVFWISLGKTSPNPRFFCPIFRGSNPLKGSIFHYQ